MNDTQLADIIRGNAQFIKFSYDVFISRGDGDGWRVARPGYRDAWAKTLDDAMELLTREDSNE